MMGDDVRIGLMRLKLWYFRPFQTDTTESLPEPVLSQSKVGN